jgi:uncharacterized protein (UPF0332 family)
MTWDEIADEQRSAAQNLLEKRANVCSRAVCSRAYYAVYALLSGRAPPAMVFPFGRLNPDHHQLAGIVDQLSGVPKRNIKLALSRLRLSRVTADYGVGLDISENVARQRLRDCAYIFREIAGR